MNKNKIKIKECEKNLSCIRTRQKKGNWINRLEINISITVSLRKVIIKKLIIKFSKELWSHKFKKIKE